MKLRTEAQLTSALKQTLQGGSKCGSSRKRKNNKNGAAASVPDTKRRKKGARLIQTHIVPRACELAMLPCVRGRGGARGRGRRRRGGR